MSAVNPGADVGGGKLVHFHQMRHVLRKIAGFAGVYGGSTKTFLPFNRSPGINRGDAGRARIPDIEKHDFF
jgi:hypothetical protein